MRRNGYAERDPAHDPRHAELVDLIGRHARSDGIHATNVPLLRLIRATAPSEQMPSLYDPSFCIVVQGRKQVVLGKKAYSYDPFHYLAVSVTLPVSGAIVEASRQQPYLCMSVEIDTKLLAELLIELGTERRPDDDDPCGLYVARSDPGMADAVLRLARLLDRPRDIPVVAPLVLREMHYRALIGHNGHRLREVCVADSQTQRIDGAIRLLRGAYDKPLSIGRLAQSVHMSPSSLHRRFKEVTRMSPLQFQKRLRLHEARRLMVAHGLEAAAAAYRVGYTSPTQFSREYRRLFGSPPRKEVEMLRDNGAV